MNQVNLADFLNRVLDVTGDFRNTRVMMQFGLPDLLEIFVDKGHPKRRIRCAWQPYGTYEDSKPFDIALDSKDGHSIIRMGHSLAPTISSPGGVIILYMTGSER